jgi:hypothetical protein
MNTQNLLNQLKWILLAGGSLFFFIRAVSLAATGGDHFGAINPIGSWFLLLSEILISGTAGGSGIIGLIQLVKNRYYNSFKIKMNLQKIILFAGITAYIIHLIRVAIWINICII